MEIRIQNPYAHFSWKVFCVKVMRVDDNFDQITPEAEFIVSNWGTLDYVIGLSCPTGPAGGPVRQPLS
jgi:hypothetical protein